MFCSVSYISLLVSVLLGIFADIDCQVVETRYGKVQGSVGQSRNGRKYYQFRGIPYAAPPILDLRFEPPRKPEPWDGIRDAIRFSEPCLQFEILYLGRVQGQEDCLKLNVFSPNIPKNEPGGKNLLPVLVFIHGGGFMSGSANVYKGKYFMDEDVVLVTLNYRVGALGKCIVKLILPHPLIKNLALQWVQVLFMNYEENNVVMHYELCHSELQLQENIANFGGDPHRTTLFGESVGGASVHYHMLSKASEGLFSRAVSQSGNAMRIYSLTNDRFGQAKVFAKKFGCPTDDSTELVDCLRRVDGRKLAEAHKEARGNIRDEYSLFAPVIERVKDGGEFIADEPAELLSSGRFSKIPWLVGVNSGEGLLYTVPIQYDRELLRTLGYPEEWKKYLPTLIGFGDQDVVAKNSERIRRQYFQTPIGSDSSFQNHMLSVLYYFNHPTKFSLSKLAAATSETSVAPPEIQIASYVAGSNNDSMSKLGSWFREYLLGFKRHFYGSYHGDELHLLFDFNQFTEPRIGDPDYELSQEMVKVWVGFASQDSVNQTGLDVQRLKWKPIDPNDPVPHYLELTLPMRIVKEPFAERLPFWKDLLNEI
ncbi:Venom carboxylesterase-6 [Orchesella cincta]|uniref:Venom carboxylesterase-6 n=1 Tax=Orchesella cincta TaxID=48709 RepID=A0A1D2MXB3_ORCCI|nr:Venom carboxylesterase-6 [Orchesella cincta]